MTVAKFEPVLPLLKIGKDKKRGQVGQVQLTSFLVVRGVSAWVRLQSSLQSGKVKVSQIGHAHASREHGTRHPAPSRNRETSSPMDPADESPRIRLKAVLQTFYKAANTAATRSSQLHRRLENRVPEKSAPQCHH